MLVPVEWINDYIDLSDVSVDEFCDRMIIMQDGCAVAQGSPADIRAAGRSDNLEEAFVTLIRRKEAKP